MLKRKNIVWIVVLCIILSGAFLGYVLWYPNTFESPKGIVVIIPKGATFQAVADSLAKSGVLQNRWSFVLAGRVLGLTKSIRVGKYLFVSGLSNAQILDDISKGKSRIVTAVTIPEGWRLEQIAKRFQHEVGIDAQVFIKLCHDTSFIRRYNISAHSLEGYLLPDTYAFYWQPEEEEIIDRMVRALLAFYNDSLHVRTKELNATQHQILTLASIVEAESVNDVERARIAGVYWNRLRKKMRLEADPTVQYALGVERRLRYSDLDVRSPYNTYRRIGLPPGPINSPGRNSILATLYPEHHNYLYFVADGYGNHRFATTYSEHQRNVYQYRKLRRELQRLAQIQNNSQQR